MATKKQQEAKAVAVTSARPSYLAQEENINIPDAGSGNRFPRIKLLQQLSPEVDKDDEKCVPDAEAGMILVEPARGGETVLFDGDSGLTFIPVFVREQFVEWVPQKLGGGWVASYDSMEEALQLKAADNEINHSIDYLVVSPQVGGGKTPLLLQFNSISKMTAARALQKSISTNETMSGITYRLRAARNSDKRCPPS